MMREKKAIKKAPLFNRMERRREPAHDPSAAGAAARGRADKPERWPARREVRGLVSLRLDPEAQAPILKSSLSSGSESHQQLVQLFSNCCYCRRGRKPVQNGGGGGAQLASPIWQEGSREPSQTRPCKCPSVLTSENGPQQCETLCLAGELDGAAAGAQERAHCGEAPPRRQPGGP